MSKQEQNTEIIEAEARLAINQVFAAAARKVRVELRKAYPFGPRASELERQIWQDKYDTALSELENWPQLCK